MPNTAAVTWAAGSPAEVLFLPGILQVGAVVLIRLPGSFQGCATSFRYRDFGGRPSPPLPLQILSARPQTVSCGPKTLSIRNSLSVHRCGYGEASRLVARFSPY